jgi:uncharacterized protein (TIGR02217 family)
MSFFEAEFPRNIGFQRVGGAAFNTAIVGVQSGQEQRNRNWVNPRAEYQATLLTDPALAADTSVFIEGVRNFFLQVGGMADGFRFYDHLDCEANNEAMVLVSGLIWQLQKTYSLAGRSYVRTITKPITSSVVDYKGIALPNSVTFTGGTTPTIDHTTGKVTFASVSGTPHASFKYHIPVRLTSDKFEPEVQPSNVSAKHTVIKWNSLGLIEVRPPNY